ncbi:MAG: two-component regulator propeller domain-containing protein, partial [Bacteroidota bacterium]
MENLHQLTYILLFFGITVWGQSIDTGVDFKQLSINDGLSHSDALTVTQDNYGFLWIGTNSGLNQYDGYQLTSYKWSPNDAKSIPGNRILKLLTTKDKIWLLIENQGLYYYDLLHYDFHLVKSLAQLGPSSYLFELDEKGHLWFFHQTTGLLTLTAKSALLPEDSLKKIAIKDYPLHLPELRQLVSTPRGKYFFDQTGRVYQYDEVTQQLTFQTFFDKGLFKAACQLNPSTLLVSCEKGLLRWHPNSDDVQSIKITEEVKPLALPTVTTIYTTEQTYYLGTTQGLYQGTFFKKQPFDQSDQLELKEIIPQVKVNQIFKDKYELLWVATSGHGLFYKNLRKLPFGHIRPSNSSATNTPSFRKNYTSAIFKEKDRPNELWIGSLAGLYLYDMPTKRYTTPIKALVDKHIRTIFQDSDGDLWVGTRESGLFRIRDKQLVRHYFKSETPRQSINSNHIVSVREDHLGNIWLASFDNGITIFNKKTNTFEPIFHEPYNQQSLGSNNLTYLYFHEKQQRMYVSSRDAGITIVDFDENDEFYYSHLAAAPNGEGLSLNYTWSIASNNGDTLYIGTIGGGLNVLKTQQNESGTYSYAFEHITKVEGLADNDVESVEMDQNGKIWMGGLGISTYNPNTKKIVNYDVEDGLQSNSFKIGASFFDDTANLLYFGGINGINFFHPNSIHPLTSPVDVQFVGLEILNTPVQVGEKINDRVLLTTRLSDSTHIRLQAEENQFTVLYKPLNFVNPQKNAVEYKLSPYQKDWIRETYPNQQASYTNLPHGNYTFQLRAVNEEGDAMSKVSTLSIYIEPYWYASNWAFSLYALLLAGLFYLYHRYLQITQANREKLAKAEKNQLLNQERLDFFTKISHEIRTPLTLIVGPIEDLIQGRQQLRPQKEVLQSISRHSHRLLHMVNKLLNFRKMDLGHEVLVATPTDLNEFV